MLLCKTAGLFLGCPYLSHKFKEKMGESLADFILKEKAEEANVSPAIRTRPSPKMDRKTA